MSDCLVCFLVLFLTIGTNLTGNASERMTEMQDDQTASSNILSIEKELLIGDAFAADFEKTVRLIADPALNVFMSRLGRNVQSYSDSRISCHFAILDSDKMDVLAFPGGHIYVTKALIQSAGSEAQLAGAVAHGIAHFSARHTARLLHGLRNHSVVAIPAIPWSWAGLNLSVPPTSFDFGIQREWELEADQLAVQYLWKSGYDPKEYVALLQKLDHEGVADHRLFMPATKDRIDIATKEIGQLPVKENYILNSRDFELVQENLLSIDRRQQAQDEGPLPGQKRPIIKRRSQ